MTLTSYTYELEWRKAKLVLVYQKWDHMFTESRILRISPELATLLMTQII